MMFGGRSNIVEQGSAGHAPGSTLRPRRSRAKFFRKKEIRDTFGFRKSNASFQERVTFRFADYIFYCRITQ